MAKKTVSRPKAKPGKDYMKPVGGTKQEGYRAPGSYLEKFDSRGKSLNHKYPVGGSATDKNTMLKGIKSLGRTGMAGMSQSLKTGINPTAMKATAGNPKPTASQMATAKKKAASKAKSKLMETQAQKKKNTKPVKGSTKGSTLKGPKPSPSPSTGRYKRNP
jgi:hypothetical protein